MSVCLSVHRRVRPSRVAVQRVGVGHLRQAQPPEGRSGPRARRRRRGADREEVRAHTRARGAIAIAPATSPPTLRVRAGCSERRRGPVSVPCRVHSSSASSSDAGSSSPAASPALPARRVPAVLGAAPPAPRVVACMSVWETTPAAHARTFALRTVVRGRARTHRCGGRWRRLRRAGRPAPAAAAAAATCRSCCCCGPASARGAGRDMCASAAASARALSAPAP